MAQSNLTMAVRYAAVDVVGSFLFFPFWWYGPGLVRTGAYCLGTVSNFAYRCGIGIWLKNLFVPMYGQHDIIGRLISFIIRLGAVAYYGLVLAVLSVVMLVLFALWVAVPAVIAYGIFSQGLGLLHSAV